MMVGVDQVTAVQSAHRMGDDMDRTGREILVADCVRELTRAIPAASERLHAGKQRVVLAREVGRGAVEVIDNSKMLRERKAAGEDEVHDGPADQTFSTFQKGTWAGSGRKPLTLARSATGGAHCPRSAIGT